MSKTYHVVLLPGEGIGIEVMASAAQVLAAISSACSIDISVEQGLIGEPAMREHGQYFPAETLHMCQRSDGILFGAVSTGGVLELRKSLDFFANLRPVKPLPCLADKSPIKPELLLGVDILFVRELAGGIYYGDSAMSQDSNGRFGYHTMIYHDWEIRRIARVALEKARSRRGHLTVAHKENALPCIRWSDIVREEASEFGDVTVEPMLVDNLAMMLLMQPQRFDVILAENLFGDILSDLGGAISGSIGMLPSASLNEAGQGLYEPVHGTAPDIAGKGIANPVGMIGSLGLMLRQWGENDASEKLDRAVIEVIERGQRTPDLLHPGSKISCSTEEFTAQVVRNVAELTVV